MSEHLSKEQIVRYRDRQIPAGELLKVDSHLSGCRDCREEISRSYGVEAALTHRPSVRKKTTDEHLSYGQLEAYIDGSMAVADSISLRNHTQSCPSCAEDLHDLESLRDELERSLAEQEPFWRQEQETKGWKLLRSPSFAHLRATTGLAAMILLGILIWQHSKRPAQNGNAATNMPVPRAISTPVESQLSAEIAALEPADQQNVQQAIKERKIDFPAAVMNLGGSGGTLMGESSGELRFAVTSPSGEFVLDSHPLFRWRPLAGANSYTVTIFDSRLNAVASSPALHDTKWKSSRALNSGRVYLWQVTATLNDGTVVNSPQPPSPEAKFEVLDQTKSQKLEQFHQAHPEAHLVLGILYAESGVLERAEEELRQVPSADSSYQNAQDFLASIREARRAKS